VVNAKTQERDRSLIHPLKSDKAEGVERAEAAKLTGDRGYLKRVPPELRNTWKALGEAEKQASILAHCRFLSDNSVFLQLDMERNE
jgi:hypothetical protein